MKTIVKAKWGRFQPGAFRLSVGAALAMLMLYGCTYYQAAPTTSAPSKFDRCWNAALGAMQDVGATTTTADRGSGVIYGYLNDSNITVSVFSQADGGVRVEFNAQGPRGQDSAVAQNLSNAYDRRMGR